MSGTALTVGDQVRWDGRAWTLAALEGARARLLGEAGAISTVLLSHLLADPQFEVIGGPPQVKMAAAGLLDTLPDHVRQQALAWERHVREVESGAAVPGEVPRAGYDPAVPGPGGVGVGGPAHHTPGVCGCPHPTGPPANRRAVTKY